MDGLEEIFDVWEVRGMILLFFYNNMNESMNYTCSMGKINVRLK
jgi:hypothetical protein